MRALRSIVGGLVLLCLVGCGGGDHEECVGFVVAEDGRVQLQNLDDGGHGGEGHAHADGEHLHGTCIPISEDRTRATATSMDGAFTVEARSLRGELTTDAPDNEGFALTILRGGEKRTGLTDVRLIARMPHHDHTISGGHGPANDFEAKGFDAVEEPGTGEYIVDPIDFNMGELWFFTVTFTADGFPREAHFAMRVTTSGM